MQNKQRLNDFCNMDMVANQIVQSLSDFVVVVDQNSKIIYFNQSFQEKCSTLFSVEIKQGLNLIESLSQYPSVQIRLKSLLDKEQHHPVEIPDFIFNDASTDVLTCKPLWDREEKRLGFCIIGHHQPDKAWQKEPKATRQRIWQDYYVNETFFDQSTNRDHLLKIIGDSIPYGVWICDENGGLLYASDSFLELLGMTIHEVRQYGWIQKLHPDDIAHTNKKWLECIDQKQSWDSENRIIDRQGMIRYVLTRGQPVYDEEGNVIYWCGINLDITQRKESQILLEDLKNNLESEVEKRTQQLKQQRQDLRSLAMQISIIEQKERKKIADDLHDYLAQLLVIGLLALRKISKKLTPVEFDKIQADTEQLQQIFNDSLNFTRNIIKELTPQSLYREGLIPSIQTLVKYFSQNGLKVVIQDQGINIDHLKEENLLLLYQSIREILFNILKHAKTTQANIQLNHTEDNDLEIKILDWGIGFDVDTALKQSVRSGHFGLFTVQERIKAIGGRLEIHSQPNQGSQFVISLPVCHNHLNQEPDQQVLLKGSQQSQNIDNLDYVKNNLIRIVLADDAVIFRQGLTNLINEIEGYQVVGEAENGQDAYELCAELKPDVVLMDVNMPWVNGIQATERIKKEFSGIKVIGLSVNDDIYTKNAMFQAGASAYLPKDGEPEDLFKTILKVYRETSNNTINQ